MTSKTRTMHLNNVTAIDVGFLTPTGVYGSSVRLSFRVTGHMDEDEQVVVDFSSIKKAIKSLIDDQEMGIDHKTVVLGKYIIYRSGTGILDVTCCGYLTPKVGPNMTAPENAFVLFDQVFPEVELDMKADVDGGLNCASEVVAMLVGELLSRELPKLFPAITKVEVLIPQDTVNPLNPKFEVTPSGSATHTLGTRSFNLNYSHGLPRSTSWGCQNILHGHAGVISFTFPRWNAAIWLFPLIDSILEAINDAYLVAERDVVKELTGEAGSNYIVVGYESMSRGHFRLMLPEGSKVLVMPIDTTVENIATYLWENHVLPYAKEQNITGLSMYLSEGLDKGAFITQE